MSMAPEPHTSQKNRRPAAPHLRDQLRPVAQRVFWWGSPEEWLDDAVRFAAQVMTYGDWEDTQLTRRLLGDNF